MAEKVKVSREVAEFIKSYEENVASCNGWEDHLLMEHSREFFGSFEGAKDEALCMKDIPPIELAKILINGYEIKQTPEEKLLATYERQRAWQETNDPFDRRAHTAYGNAIVYTLDTLGIKIEGINK